MDNSVEGGSNQPGRLCHIGRGALATEHQPTIATEQPLGNEILTKKRKEKERGGVAGESLLNFCLVYKLTYIIYMCIYLHLCVHINMHCCGHVDRYVFIASNPFISKFSIYFHCMSHLPMKMAEKTTLGGLVINSYTLTKSYWTGSIESFYLQKKQKHLSC